MATKRTGTMTQSKAVATIVAVLVQLPDQADLEAVCYKAAQLASYERDLAEARKLWREFDAWDKAEGKPGFPTFRDFLVYSKENGEWRWAIPRNI